MGCFVPLFSNFGYCKHSTDGESWWNDSAVSLLLNAALEWPQWLNQHEQFLENAHRQQIKMVPYWGLSFEFNKVFLQQNEQNLHLTATFAMKVSTCSTGDILVIGSHVGINQNMHSDGFVVQ